MRTFENISKIDLVILKDMLMKEKNSTLKSISIYDLSVLKVAKVDTVYKRLKYLLKIGLVDVGIKESRRKTYFITQNGLEKIKSFEKGKNYEK